MFTTESWIHFSSTEQLREMARKSGSRVFSGNQRVVVTYEGTLEIKTLAFYEICLTSTEMRWAHLLFGSRLIPNTHN
jgi:uncharacterized protein (DUF952 family)